jgi:ABC-type polysaccharide/polyol phosphate transport system ATPase subunit
MGDIAIQVEKLSKQFKISVVKNRYQTLFDRLTDGLKGLFRRHGHLSPANDTIWALKGVSLEVEQGEVVVSSALMGWAKVLTQNPYPYNGADRRPG